MRRFELVAGDAALLPGAERGQLQRGDERLRKEPAGRAGAALQGYQQNALLDVIPYSALISACENGQQPECALELFKLIQRPGALPHVITYSALIST